MDSCKSSNQKRDCYDRRIIIKPIDQVNATTKTLVVVDGQTVAGETALWLRSSSAHDTSTSTGLYSCRAKTTAWTVTECGSSAVRSLLKRARKQLVFRIEFHPSQWWQKQKPST